MWEKSSWTHTTRGTGDIEDKPTRDLLSELLAEGKHLLHEEVLLAKLEIRAEAKKVGKGAGAIGAAGIAAHTALLCLAACLVLALAGVMKAWVAAFIVMALFAAVAGGLFYWGRSRLQTVHKPEQTLKNLEEDKRWMKDTLHKVKSHTRANA